MTSVIRGDDSFDSAELASGTWTPVVQGSATPGACSYTWRVAAYQRVRDMVTITFRVDWTGHTGAGNIVITGVPYPIRAGQMAAAPLMSSLSAVPAVYMDAVNNLPDRMFVWSTSGSFVQVALPSSGALIGGLSYPI